MRSDRDEDDSGAADDSPSSEITLRHAVDLLSQGGEAARRLNQYDDLARRIPDLVESTAALLRILEQLGCDGMKLLRRDKRLAALADHYEYWTCESRSAEIAPSDHLSFSVHASPLLQSVRLIRSQIRHLSKREKTVVLELAAGELRISIRGWGLSVPAAYKQPGRCVVSRVFLDVLLQSLKTDELLNCDVHPNYYRINAVKHSYSQRQRGDLPFPEEDYE